AGCAAPVAHATLLRAVTLVAGRPPLPEELVIETLSSSMCNVRAASWVWTAYYCALSLHGPKDLHPMALRLAARCILGTRVEQHIIGQTVLSWRTSSLHVAERLDDFASWLLAL